MILVTGATGFVGGAVVNRSVADGMAGEFRAAVRVGSLPTGLGVREVPVGDLAPETDWSVALEGVTCVVHCAARVHLMQDRSSDPLVEYRRVNTSGTLHLAQCAVEAGARRFVFVSSVKVNGEATLPGRAFNADDRPAPLDAYGVSKWEAEQGLREIAKRTGLEVVIVRPPLVYGPGVKANFATMMRWLRRGIPLPLGAIHNQRSLVALDNLVDLIITCIKHPAAANQTFLVSDGEDVSTTDLLRRMGRAMGRPAHLVPVPAGALQLAAALAGKRDVAQRLCGSLQVDIAKTRNLLGWRPPLTLDQGLEKAAQSFSS